jgi:GrpB protein
MQVHVLLGEAWRVAGVRSDQSSSAATSALRDCLRAEPREARSAEALKRSLAARGPGDRRAYMAGKDACVPALAQRALSWARTGGWRPLSRRVCLRRDPLADAANPGARVVSKEAQGDRGPAS